MQTTQAEVKLVNARVQHNIPLAFTDHFSPLMKDIFPTVKLLVILHQPAPKQTAWLTVRLLHTSRQLWLILRNHPHLLSLLMGLMIPVCRRWTQLPYVCLTKVRAWSLLDFWICVSLKVHVRCNWLLAICIHVSVNITDLYHNRWSVCNCSGDFWTTGSCLQKNGIPWVNCVGAGVNNTSVNLGKRNSIFTRVLERNPSVYFMGCPCHIVHNTCMKASETFTKVQLYYDL